jgi:hypothetical protein
LRKSVGNQYRATIHVFVTKGIYKEHLGETKTEVSKKLVPLHPYQLEDLKAARGSSPKHT